jgi:hypothetical protein
MLQGLHWTKNIEGDSDRIIKKQLLMCVKNGFFFFFGDIIYNYEIGNNAVPTLALGSWPWLTHVTLD